MLRPAPLHIPDGFLSPIVAIVGWILAIIFITIAIRQTKDQLGEKQVPLMGILAAFIFAAQVINFPVAGGTSGHLLGGALAAIVVGPWGATLIMSAVIGVQALLFQDGGLLVMGWNIVNMGVITAFSGYAAYTLLLRGIGEGKAARIAAAFAAGWFSVQIAAIATAVELAVSGTSPLQLVLPAMVGVHMVIGLGEGMITAAAVGVIQASRPDILIMGERAPGRVGAVFSVVGLVIALLVTLFSPLAAPSPDGLERIAEDIGFLMLSQDPAFEIFSNYALPFIGGEALATILAIMVGTLIVFGLAWIIARTLAVREAAGD